LVSSVLVSCGGTSEEELIGDWQRRAFFYGTARSHAATFVIGNKGYVCCGYDGLKLRRNDVCVFDHTAANGMGSWQRLKDFPGPRRSHAVGFSINDFGYIGAGWDGDETDMKDFWRFDPNTGEWTEVAPLPEMAYPRRGAIAFSLSVGGEVYGYVGFGFFEVTNDKGYLLDLWQFDPKGKTGELDGRWTEVTGYGGWKREGALVFILDNKAYICTGKSSNTSVYDFWVFDPNNAESTWKQKKTMWDANPDEDYDDDYTGLPRSYGSAYVVSVSGQLRGHIVGGEGGNAVKNWEYDHDNDLWTQRTNFYNYRSGSSREGMVSFSFPDGKAFVGMGKAGSSYFDDLWEFIPLMDDDIYSDQ